MGRILRRFVGKLAGVSAVVCLTLGSWFYLWAGYESDVFEQIADDALSHRPQEVEPVLQLTHAAHEMVAPRYRIFAGTSYTNLADSLLRTPLDDLIDGRGACGSFSTVLARLLQVSGYEFRMVQMHCAHSRGCHMVVEARQDGDWVVLDAMYDAAFRRPDGRLAGIDEVGGDWDYYRRQAPEAMPVSEYTFQSYDYTNWEKVPYLMPALKHLLGWFVGDRIDTLSLRAYVIDRGRVLAIMLLGFGVLLGLLRWVLGGPREEETRFAEGGAR